MPNRRFSIRTHITVLAASLAIPLLGLLSISLYQGVRSQVESAERGLLDQAEGAGLAVQQFLEDSERILRGLAMEPGLTSLDPETCTDLITHLSGLVLPTYTNLLSVDSTGSATCSLVPQPEGLSSTQQGIWFAGAWEAGGFSISPVQKGRASGRWATVLAYPIRDPDEQQIGLLVLGLDLLRFEEILAKLSPEGEGIITLMERDGTVVARSRNSDLYVGQTPQGESPFLSSEDDSIGRGVSTGPVLEGGEYLWGHAGVPGTEWVVFAGLPVQEIYGPLYSQWIRTSLFLVVVLGFVTILGRRIYRSITNPLMDLASDAKAAKPGDTSPLKAQGPREIAQVATRFNEAWGAWSEAEKERQFSVERTRSLVENAVTGIYISTESGRFLEVNQAMVDLLGYESRSELLATPVSSLYGSVDRRLQVLASFGKEDSFEGVEQTWHKKDGTQVSVRLFGRKYRLPDGEITWEVIVEDVTKLRALQGQYLQAQKMEALGRMAGGIAHDFNNLLTVVQGQAELILEDSAVGEDLKAQVREIVEAADRGANLNRQLLAFGRRGSGVRETVDLNQILSGFELVLRRAVGEEISLEIVMGHDLGWIRGDRGELEQVAMNLVVNARDAMPRGGSLLIETYNAELDEEESAAFPPSVPGRHVVLAVSDTGVGIDPETLPSIFEPFFSTKPEAQGTGLGLATVYGIVAELEGHIRVESIPGEGTTFRLFFPLTEFVAQTEPAAKPEVTGSSGSGMILLAEDEEAVRRLSTRILERAGYEVLPAENGRVALDLAMEHEGTLDLLVSDVVMPELRGPDLAEALARAGKVKRVVLFSGYPEGMKDAGLRGLERWELLPKPFTSRELLAAVQRALGTED